MEDFFDYLIIDELMDNPGLCRPWRTIIQGKMIVEYHFFDFKSKYISLV